MRRSNNPEVIPPAWILYSNMAPLRAEAGLVTGSSAYCLKYGKVSILLIR